MKLIKLTALAFFLMSIIACNKDEDSISSDELVGTWNLTDYHYTGSSTTTVSATGQTLTVFYTGVANNFVDPKMIITSNPNTYTTTGSYNIKLTNNPGSGEVITNQPVNSNETGTWVKNGNKLIFSSSSTKDVAEFEILTLTSTTLSLKFQKEVNQILGAGVTSKSNTTGFGTYTR